MRGKAREDRLPLEGVLKSMREHLEVATRAIAEADIPEVSALLDATLGAGQWTLDITVPGSHRVAVLENRIVGAASASLIKEGMEMVPGMGRPAGLIRLVAVHEAARNRGVASRLVDEVCAECLAAGAADLAAFAWVYRRTGAAPVAGVLKRHGFVHLKRIEGLYSGTDASECPQCGSAPCVCPADLYVRRGDLSQGSGMPRGL